MVQMLSGGTARFSAYCRPIVSLDSLALLMTTRTLAPVCAAAPVASASALVAPATISPARALGEERPIRPRNLVEPPAASDLPSLSRCRRAHRHRREGEQI